VTDNSQPLFDRVGGMTFFEQLVQAFYEEVGGDEVLLPLYPSDDLDGARHRLTLFLAQYWGGPHAYMEERGHPMLRMRHFPYMIGPLQRDHWLICMASAVQRTTQDRSLQAELMDYFINAAEHMRNETIPMDQRPSIPS
jgi:hemoglobin